MLILTESSLHIWSGDEKQKGGTMSKIEKSIHYLEISELKSSDPKHVG
jgi:hypothetical protein